MERAWRSILSRYGQRAALLQGAQQVQVRAILQPVADRERDQEVPSPLGERRQERVLYLGPGDSPLDTDTVVQWGDRQFRVQRAHLAGAEVCPHWWAMLYPREEESG